MWEAGQEAAGWVACGQVGGEVASRRRKHVGGDAKGEWRGRPAGIGLTQVWKGLDRAESGGAEKDRDCGSRRNGGALSTCPKGHLLS